MQIESFRSVLDSRFFARMKNREDILISRMYAKTLKHSMWGPIIMAFLCILPSSLLHSTKDLSVRQIVIRRVIQVLMMEGILCGRLGAGMYGCRGNEPPIGTTEKGAIIKWKNRADGCYAPFVIAKPVYGYARIRYFKTSCYSVQSVSRSD